MEEISLELSPHMEEISLAISPSVDSEIIFCIPENKWIIKISKNGFKFNHKEFPLVQADGFAQAFVDILEKQYVVTMTKRNSMKPYLLFSYYVYYPDGGWDDFDKDFDSVDEAIEYLKNIKDCRHAHIVFSGKIVMVCLYGDGMYQDEKDVDGKWCELDEYQKIIRVL